MISTSPGPALATTTLTHSIEELRAAVHARLQSQGWRARVSNPLQAAIALAMVALFDALLGLIAAMRAAPSKDAVSDAKRASGGTDGGEQAPGATDEETAQGGHADDASTRRRPVADRSSDDAAEDVAATDRKSMNVEPADAEPASDGPADTDRVDEAPGDEALSAGATPPPARERLVPRESGAWTTCPRAPGSRRRTGRSRRSRLSRYRFGCSSGCSSLARSRSCVGSRQPSHVVFITI